MKKINGKFESFLLVMFGMFIGMFMTMMYFSKSSTEESTGTTIKPAKSYVVIANQRTVLPDALRAGTIHCTKAITLATHSLQNCNREIIQMHSMQIADSTSFQRAQTDFHGISMPLEEVLIIRLGLILQTHNYVIVRNTEKYSEGIFEQRIKDQQSSLGIINGDFQKMEIAYKNIQKLHNDFLAQLQSPKET